MGNQAKRIQRFTETKEQRALPRAMEIYTLRNTENLTYAEIAQRFDISTTQAFRDYAKAQEIVLTKLAAKGDKARGKHARMLYAMLASLEDKALTGDLETIAESRKLIGELNKMYGVYPSADTQVTINVENYRLVWGNEESPGNVIPGRTVHRDNDNG